MKRCSGPARRSMTICATDQRTGFLSKGRKEEETDVALETISFLHAMLNLGDVVLLEHDEVETAVRGEKILCNAAQTSKSVSGQNMEKHIRRSGCRLTATCSSKMFVTSMPSVPPAQVLAMLAPSCAESASGVSVGT